MKSLLSVISLDIVIMIFKMHLWGNCMSYSCWLHRQNKLRTVYDVVYCFLCIKKARLHIAYLSSMKNTTVIQTENKASNEHSPSLKQSMTLIMTLV